MAIFIFNFIIIGLLSTALVFYWILLKRMNRLHADVREFDLQLKSIIESLEKKMCAQELDVSAIKDDFKQFQTKIIKIGQHKNYHSV